MSTPVPFLFLVALLQDVRSKQSHDVSKETIGPVVSLNFDIPHTFVLPLKVATKSK
jgi:hypothetical protein